MEYEYRGYKFILDDSEGCYLKVLYDSEKGREAVGFVGVNLNGGTQHLPCAWTTNIRDVTPGGLSRGDGAISPETGLKHLLRRYVQNLLEKENEIAYKKELAEFDPEAACKALHEFVENLKSD